MRPAKYTQPSSSTYPRSPLQYQPLPRGVSHGLHVAVVALEWPHAKCVDDLPHALLGIDETAIIIESSLRDLATVGVDNGDPLPEASDRAPGWTAGAVQRDGTLGGAEDVDDFDTKALCRCLDDVR